MEILKNLEKYIDNLKQIRALSSPSLNGIFDETGYSRQLSENFVRIGHLAEENREILEEYLFPICRSDKALDEAELKLLTYFEEQLLDAVNAENLDIPIVYIVSERLLNDALSKGDILQSIRRMDMQISTCYTLMNMTGRIAGYPELAERYRREGISTGEVFLDLREKKRFQRLESDKAKELVLINARFMECFYEQSVGEREYNEKSLELLRRSLEINEDPFYTDLMPDYDWRYDRYRTLTYYSQSTDYSNCRKFTDEQLEEIWERTEELWTLWHTDPEYFSGLEKESYIKFHLIRNRYYAGKISREECTESLVQLFVTIPVSSVSLTQFLSMVESFLILSLNLSRRTPVWGL